MSQTQSVKAVAMIAPGKMEMRRYPYPNVDCNSAILKVEMTGVCGTDKHIFKGEASSIRGQSIFPYIGGHEVIGTIRGDRRPCRTHDGLRSSTFEGRRPGGAGGGSELR